MPGEQAKLIKERPKKDVNVSSANDNISEVAHAENLRELLSKIGRAEIGEPEESVDTIEPVMHTRKEPAKSIPTAQVLDIKPALQPEKTKSVQEIIKSVKNVDADNTKSEEAPSTVELTPEETDALVEGLSGYFAEILNNPDNWATEAHMPEDGILPDETYLGSEPAQLQEFMLELKELFDEDAESQEIHSSEDLQTGFIQSIESVTEHDASFSENLAVAIDLLEPEEADAAKESLSVIVDKIQTIFEDIDFDAESIAQALESHDTELNELKGLCLELLERLGFEATEQNANKLLLKLLKGTYATIYISQERKINLAESEEMGTHEHKYDPPFMGLARLGAYKKFSHLGLGYLALIVATVR